MKNFSYYKARIDRGFYPSSRIFKQSLGRSLLTQRVKDQLVAYAEKVLTPTAPDNHVEPQGVKEAPSPTPRMLETIREIRGDAEEIRPLTVVFGGAKTTSVRANRLILLIKILSGPSQEELQQLFSEGASVGLIHQDLYEEMNAVIALLHKTK